eukprot:XP_002261278.1 SICA antigen [Plasmodium knowlesi strain H]
MTTASTEGDGGLLQKWFEQHANVAPAGTGADSASRAKQITATLKDDLDKKFKELGERLIRQESTEIGNFCGNDVKWGKGGWELHYMQVLCTAIAEIKYFISGVETQRTRLHGTTDSQAKIEHLSNAEAYARCVVGAVALSTIYGDHCHMGEAIKKVEGAFEEKIRRHLKGKGGTRDLSNQLDVCKEITTADLMVGKAVLGNTIREWTQKKRDEGGPYQGEWKLGNEWGRWEIVCNQGKRARGGDGEATKKKYLNENKEVITKFSGLKDDSTQKNPGDVSVADLLADVDGKYKLTEKDLRKALESAMEAGTFKVDKAIENLTNASQKVQGKGKIGIQQFLLLHVAECMKDNSKKTFCQRLQCAKQYWKLNNKGQSEDNFWNNYVNGELSYLFNSAAAINGGTQGANCDKDNTLHSANKAACKQITAKLEHIYQNKIGKAGDRLSEQIIRCLLLKEYAKKLKEKAENKGYCDIESGLSKAFDLWNENNKNGGHCRNGGPCVECKLEDDVNYGTCQIDNENVKTKVKSMLENNKRTQYPQIEKTLADFNENNSLCERIKCASKWYENNKGHGSGQVSGHTRSLINNFWEGNDSAVAKLWTELSTEMAKANGNADGDCGQVNDNGTLRPATPSEKTACNFLHAGFKELYKTTTTLSAPAGADIWKNNPSLKQAMGCSLLHAYAKEMKKRSTCLIDDGIQRAFDTAGRGGQNGTDIPCKWNEDNFKSCGVKTKDNGEEKNVTEKVEKIVQEDTTKIKEMQTKINDMPLCDRVKCVTARWMNEGNGGGKKRQWNEMWKKVGEEIPKLGTALGSATTTTKKDVETYCNGLQGQNGREADKEACLLIAAGLKNLYDIKDNGGTNGVDVDASFQRTMQCVLLNAIADKMKEKLPCKEERSVEKGITEAFNKSGNIKNASNGCSDANKCFTCERFNEYRSCHIRENSSTLKVTMLKDKVDEVLDKDGKAEMEKIQDQAVKDICKPCTESGTLCTQLKCVAGKWGERNKGTINGTPASWDDMQRDFETELKALLEDMQDITEQATAATYCNGSGAGWEDGAAKEANQAACKLVAAGLQHISKIQHEYSTETGQPEKNKNPYDKQEFKQFASCLMLKAIVQRMKEDSKICDIQPGITKAFSVAETIKNEHCKNDKPCIVCQWTDEDYNKLDSCTIAADSVKVKEKLNEILEDEKTEVDSTLKEVLKTDQPEGVPLCNRLQCLASRDTFWTTDVKKLWDELALAMTKANGTSINGGCNKMDDDRDPTTPERKACQYLTLGFNQLKTISATLPKNGNNILDKHPSLRQTVGCILLKEYAKKMKGQSKCLIESGIKKAFGSWGQIPNGPCTASSGPCIECKWEDKLDTCTITTNVIHENITGKLKTVESKMEKEATTTMEEVNRTESLCQQLKCAAPKWFQSKAGNSRTKKQTWCDFWKEGVRDGLQKMFQQIDQNGKDKNNTTCQQFGDGNDDSVERKACNHITAGLDYIKNISSGSGGSGNPLLDRAVGCIALNMYADQIINASKEKCPIGEDKIKQMFHDWHEKTKYSCQNSANNHGCFECKRVPNSEFKDCELSVDSTLINTTQNGNCSSNDNKKEVQTQMDVLLNEDKSTPNSINTTMKQTLDEITDMKSSFCTQLQCAAKKWGKINSKKTSQNGTVTWYDMKTEIETELKELLGYMTQSKNQTKVAKYCNENNNNWNTLGTKERQTNKAACLLFASGLKHIYNQKKGQFNGPSFGQTMGCLFLKEYAKQLKDLANEKKKGYSWVHPLCDIDKGIKHAFGKSGDIMEETSKCKKSGSTNDCFVCTQNQGYDDCKIGIDSVKTNVETIFQDKQKKDHMQQTLENTVCPILLTDLLTPFVPLAPVSIGLSAMAYYLWKYFGPLGKGGPRFKRSPAEIPGSSVQEQVLDHVQQDSSHEYRLVKERKPRSAPKRMKRSSRVNRRTIIEIHFEVLDECQKGDTQLNQKHFMELLVREFMGSELMEEEQVSKEEVLMEDVPMESIPSEQVPMERVPNLGSGFMV